MSTIKNLIEIHTKILFYLEQLATVINDLSQSQTNSQTSDTRVTGQLNWSKNVRETLQLIKRGTVQDITTHLCSKQLVPANKIQIAYFRIQETLWAFKSRRIVKKTGTKQNAIWELCDDKNAEQQQREVTNGNN